MAQQIKHIAAQTLAIGERLKSVYLTNLAHIIDTGYYTEKLALTIIGRSRHLTQILKAVTNVDDLIPKSSYRRGGYTHIVIRYAESLQYRVGGQEHSTFVVTEEVFREEMEKANETSIIWYGEIGVNAEFLKTMNLTLVCSDKGTFGFDWQRILLQTDFVLPVLDAAQLLSSREREFLSTTVEYICSSNRYAVVVAGMEMIGKDEKTEVMEYVNSWLTTLNPGKVQAIPFGNEEQDVLINFVTQQIPANALHIRQQTHTCNGRYCIEEIDRCSREIKVSLQGNQEHLTEAIQALDLNCDKLNNKIASAERNIEIFITGSIKSQFIRKIDEFASLLDENLRNEIFSCKDINEATRKIPAYLKNVWQQFIEQQNLWLKNSVFAETIKLSKTIEDDIKEIVSSMDEEILLAMEQYLPERFKYNTFLFPKRDKGDSLKYIDLGAVALLLFSIPWAIVVFGTSQLIRLFFREERLKAKKESLAESAIESNRKLKKQMIVQADSSVENIAASLKKQVKGVYQSIIQEFNTALETYKTNIENAQDLIEYIDTLGQLVVPPAESELH